jgi:uncharacterized membrane protein
MKKYFITGLITLLPVALTLMIVFWLVDFFTNPFVNIFENLLLSYEKERGLGIMHHTTTVMLLSRLITLLVLFLITLLLGFFGRKFFSSLTNRLFIHIPVIKSVYRISKEITKSLFSQGAKTFKQTVLIPFPRETTYTIGFVTGEVPPGLKEKINTSSLSVFVPTAPHPFSGYILITPRAELIEIDVTTEEAFKFILSCGTIAFPEKPKE